MTPDEVNARIAVLTHPRYGKGKTLGFPNGWPDYCGDLNATMAVIKERWPDAEIRLSSNMAYIEFWEDTILEPAKGYGDTDAERLARALLAALEAGDA